MNNISVVRYRTVLSNDSNYADIYSPKGKLVASFYMKLENGRAILCDKVSDTQATVPTYEKVTLIKPFDYDKRSDILSVFMMMDNKSGLTFQSYISDLVETKMFNFPNPSHCPSKPSHNPFEERYVTLDELLYETKMRKHADDEIKEMIEHGADMKDCFKDKLHDLEASMTKEEYVNKSQDKKIDTILGSMDKLKFHVTSNLADFKVSLNEEIEKRISAQNEMFNAYSNAQKHIDRNSDKINEIKDADNKTSHKIDDLRNYVKHTESRLEDSIAQEKMDRRKKDEEIIHSFDRKYQPKGEYIGYNFIDDKKHLVLDSNTVISTSNHGYISNLISSSDDNAFFGSQTLSLRLLGDTDRPMYNCKEIALMSDLEKNIDVDQVNDKLTKLEHEFYHYQEWVNKQLTDLTSLMLEIKNSLGESGEDND